MSVSSRAPGNTALSDIGSFSTLSGQTTQSFTESFAIEDTQTPTCAENEFTTETGFAPSGMTGPYQFLPTNLLTGYTTPQSTMVTPRNRPFYRAVTRLSQLLCRRDILRHGQDNEGLHQHDLEEV